MRGLAARHRMMLLALALALPPRLLVLAGYRPAVLFRLDTFDYLWGAVHVAPNPVNPGGYSLFLWLLRPLHSLVLITVVQQLAGLGTAVLMYALVRRRGLPGGLLLPRRRTGAAALLWLCALAALVLPVAEHEYVYRYAYPAVPLACLAAALALPARTRPSLTGRAAQRPTYRVMVLPWGACPVGL